MKNHILSALGLTLSVAFLASCSDSSPTGSSEQKSPAGAMKGLSGAGSSFAAPFIQRAASDFAKKDPSVQVNYQSVGSGAGIKQFTQGTVDFGASDAAMTDEQIAAVPGGVAMIPETAGTIVLSYNLPGNPALKLSREAFTGIYLGTVKNWNDPIIAKDNPGVNLPELPINVAYRSDGSGTTFVFTKHLASVSPQFNQKVGSGTAVSFPVGVGGKGNEGVTALIKQTPGTIGYVEFGYAEGNKLPMASLENKSGNFVAPTIESGMSSLASVEMPANLRIWPEDPAGSGDYPIATFTWLLLRKDNPDKSKVEALKSFVEFVLTDAQKNAVELGYIPLPEQVVTKAKAALAEVK